MPTPTNKGIFAPQYYGTVYYYAVLASCRKAVIDLGLRYDKRFKSVHRTTIVDTRGPLTLTVPVAKGPAFGEGGIRRWSDMNVSSHGEWWTDHRVSLESAYGRTPYFEFYIDRFLPWLRDTNESVTDFDRGLDEVVRRTLGLTTEVVYSLDDIDAEEYEDYRQDQFLESAITPRRLKSPPLTRELTDVRYYQVRADRLGFVPGLSILDLLFNMGPEAQLVLDKMMKG